MKKGLLNYLLCIECKSQDLRLVAKEELNDEVKEGQLICNKCGRSYGISDFIPDFLPKGLSKVESQVRENFGYKWKLHPSLLHTYKKRFLDEIFPVQENFIKGKTVLNACCGIGIIDYYCASSGAKEVVGFDVSDSVHGARQNCSKFKNTNFVKADSFNVPLKADFDYVLCLAAVHHLKNPAQGFKILTGFIKPGGHFSIWVYAHEGNAVVRLFVEPIRKYIGTKFPMPVVNRLSIFMGTFLWLIIKMIYKPLKKAGVKKKILPMQEYLFYIDLWPLKQVWEMVFDQVLSPITHYHKGREIESWVKQSNLKLLSLTRLNDNSWRCFAQKCAE